MNAPQGSEAWLIERCGHATASMFSAILATIKTGEAKTRRDYRYQLAAERLSGAPTETYQNAAMLWGKSNEAGAREAYEAKTGVIVEQTGFTKHAGIPWVGCSPDGRISDDGLLEIKCPKPTTHIEWMEAGKAPTEHLPQIFGQLWVEQRQWCDFVSFDPRFPEPLQLFIVRVERDDKYIAELERKVKEFLVEVDEMVQRLLRKAA